MRALLLVLVGCASEPKIIEVIDTGRACVVASQDLGTDRSQEFEVGKSVFVRYELGQCLSSSCTRDREASCTVAIKGQGRTVSSEFRWVDTTVGACTDDCVGLTATCETDVLGAGTYELRFGGGATIALTIPSQVAGAPCVDVAP